LRSEDRSMHGLLARLRVRRVPCEAKMFANINTAGDLPLLQETS